MELNKTDFVPAEAFKSTPVSKTRCLYAFAGITVSCNVFFSAFSTFFASEKLHPTKKVVRDSVAIPIRKMKRFM